MKTEAQPEHVCRLYPFPADRRTREIREAVEALWQRRSSSRATDDMARRIEARLIVSMRRSGLTESMIDRQLERFAAAVDADLHHREIVELYRSQRGPGEPAA